MSRTGYVCRSVLAAFSHVRFAIQHSPFACSLRQGALRTRSVAVLAMSVALSAAMLVASPVAKAGNSKADESCFDMLLVSVVDGDTVFGYIHTSDPLVAIRAKLRLTGIDTPERGYRAHCAAEKAHAEEAHAYLKDLLEPALGKPTSQMVRACAVTRDKYAMRRLGRLEVRLRNGWLDTGEQMLRKGYAFPYKGGARGSRWCDCLEKGQCPAGFSAAPGRPRKSAALN